MNKGRRQQDGGQARSGRPLASPAPAEAADDIVTMLKFIQTRYTDLRGQAALPTTVAQEIHAALAAVERRLREPIPDETVTHLANEPPIMESIARILSLMDGLGASSPRPVAAPKAGDDAAVLAPERTADVVAAETLPVPLNPSLMAAVEGIFSPRRWEPNSDGHPQFDYESRDRSGRIALTFARNPQTVDGMTALWEAVKSLTTETADILLLLVSRIAELPNPRKDTVYMRLEEIAEARGVFVRDGSSAKLHDHFREQILRLADLRLSIRWQNIDDDDTIDFARDRPAHLLTIVDYTRRRQGTTWRAFEFSCGPALACFMRQDELRLVGQYSKALLRLSPHTQGWTKRVGTFYSFVGAAAGEAGAPIAVSARALLKFVGLEPDLDHPGRTVDAMVRAHTELYEIGLLAHPSDWEPPHRRKGFFEDWLDTPRTIYLSTLVMPMLAGDRNGAAQRLPSPSHEFTCPADAAELRAQPQLIKTFCEHYGIRLGDLASAVGIAASSMSRYTQGQRPLPDTVASKVIAIWREKENTRGL